MKQQLESNSSEGSENPVDLTQLPPGWSWSKVSDVGDVKLGRQRSPEHHNGTHMRPYLRVANVYEGRIDLSDVLQMNFTPEEFELYQLRYGDILLNEGQSLEWVGRPAMYRDELPGSCFQNTLIRFRPHRGISGRFALLVFRHYLHSRRFQRIARWTVNIAHLGAGRFAEVEFPVPPANEQARIVAKVEELLSDLDAGVAALERAKANLKRYRAAVLKAAVEGRLTAVWRERHPAAEPASKLLERILDERRRRWEAEQEAKFAASGKTPPKNWREKYAEPTPPDTSELPELPGGWCWATVDQVAEVQGGIQKQPKRTPSTNAYPFLRVANVHRDRLELSEVHRIELFSNELEKLRLVQGDLLIVEGNGSKTEIGRSALWGGEIEDCVHQNHIIRVRRLAGSPGYLNYYWNSPTGNQRVMDQAASTSGLYTLSVTKVCLLPIPLPPEEEQAQITCEVEERLSIIHSAEQQIAADLRRVDRLRLSILKHAFEGRLVPQDPTDEPASVLLERIKAERDGVTIEKAKPPRTRRGASVSKPACPEGNPG